MQKCAFFHEGRWQIRPGTRTTPAPTTTLLREFGHLPLSPGTSILLNPDSKRDSFGLVVQAMGAGLNSDALTLLIMAVNTRAFLRHFYEAGAHLINPSLIIDIGNETTQFSSFFENFPDY